MGWRTNSFDPPVTHCAFQWGTNQPWVEYPVRTDADGAYCYIDNTVVNPGVYAVRIKSVLRVGETAQESGVSVPFYILKIRSASGQDWIGNYEALCRNQTCNFFPTQ